MDATLLANNAQHCRAQHVASICMEPQQCWPRENVWTRALQSFFRNTVPECIASLEDRQQCWQLLRSFACTTQQLPATPNNFSSNSVNTWSLTEDQIHLIPKVYSKRIFFCPVHNASTPCSLQAFGIRCIPIISLYTDYVLLQCYLCLNTGIFSWVTNNKPC